jgi:hypothetical protein
MQEIKDKRAAVTNRLPSVICGLLRVCALLELRALRPACAAAAAASPLLRCCQQLPAPALSLLHDELPE